MASDKSISSRLLTMKFMQRGIVNSPSASPSHQRSSKRQRLSSGAAAPRHSDADIEALQAAIADEEVKRAELMERVAAEKGDTRWVLSVQERPIARTATTTSTTETRERSLNVAVAGFADIDEDASASDSGEEDEDDDGPAGRRSYGQKPQNTHAGRADDDEDNSDNESDYYDPSSIDAMIAEAQSAARSTGPRSNGDRMPTSISGGGGSSSNRNTPKKSFKCYKCGQEGHMAKLCPNR